MKLTLGIDTSCYTTSLCLVGEGGNILSDQRRILQVASGARGLRQSEALFQHVQNLPELTAELAPFIEKGQLVAVGVSAKPRPQDDSYLPVFLSGTGLARSIAHFTGAAYYELTHQETHIWSGIGSAGGPKSSQFLAIHLSGGTTELTEVTTSITDLGFQIKLLGGTSDLHAGQFVDRLGVKLGLPFPAGPHLEKIAEKTGETVPVSTFHRNGEVSFSGPLTALERMVEDVEAAILARTCFNAIARTLIKWIKWAGEQTECRELLLIGGVAANKLIRQKLRQALPQWRLYFAAPKYSVDNAYGAAYFAALACGLITD